MTTKMTYLGVKSYDRHKKYRFLFFFSVLKFNFGFSRIRRLKKRQEKYLKTKFLKKTKKNNLKIAAKKALK